MIHAQRLETRNQVIQVRLVAARGARSLQGLERTSEVPHWKPEFS